VKRKFILNRDSGTLHKLPASEACNTDQIGARSFFADTVQAAAHVRFRRLCKRCFPRLWNRAAR